MEDRNNLKQKTEEDLKLTSWATNIFLNSVKGAAPEPDTFMLGAKYITDNPPNYIIIKITRLVHYYEIFATTDKHFIRRGYIDFVKRHWNDPLDLDCPIEDMELEYFPEEIKR